MTKIVIKTHSGNEKSITRQSNGDALILVNDNVVPENEKYKKLFLLSYSLNVAAEYMLSMAREAVLFDYIEYGNGRKNYIVEDTDLMQLKITNNRNDYNMLGASASCDFILGTAQDMLKLSAVHAFCKMSESHRLNMNLESDHEEFVLCAFIRRNEIRTRDLLSD